MLKLAIVGRANVGKSTFFNQVTEQNTAIVSDIPETTRDRQYGKALILGENCLFIDTAGITDKENKYHDVLQSQTESAIKEADVILFMVDAREGITYQDRDIANFLRRQKGNKKVFLLVNKTEGLAKNEAVLDFFELGLGKPYPISAKRGLGIEKTFQEIFANIDIKPTFIWDKNFENAIKIAFVGKPNVGKSTIINKILHEDRLLVYDEAGTTRDSIFVPFRKGIYEYLLIDTAGVRRKRKVTEEIEKVSIAKTLESVTIANVVVLMIDACKNINDQDLHLINFILESGKGIVVVVNKWDIATCYEQQRVKDEIDRKLAFLSFARVHYLSAIREEEASIKSLFKSIDEAYRANASNFKTSELCRVLEKAVQKNPPPIGDRFRIKIKFANQLKTQPPVICIRGNQVEKLPAQYVRYLIREFREAFKLKGTPILIELKNDINPYA